MVLGIVAISAISRVQRAKYDAQNGIVSDRGQQRSERWSRRHGTQQTLVDSAQPSPRELDQQREIAELRERIHVLERIATDGRQTHALAAEIESLRGK